MPTDESYLDSLLSGLTSDSGKKNEDRLAAYRRENRKEEVQEEKRDIPEHEIPGFLSEFLTKDDSEEAKGKPEESFIPEDDDEQLTDGYNIFSDYDDEAIDRMINEELSGEEFTGELFSDFKNSNDADITETLYEETAVEDVPETFEDAHEDTSDGLFQFNSMPEEEYSEEDFDLRDDSLNFITEPDPDPIDFSDADGLPDLDAGGDMPDLFANLGQDEGDSFDSPTDDLDSLLGEIGAFETETADSVRESDLLDIQGNETDDGEDPLNAIGAAELSGGDVFEDPLAMSDDADPLSEMGAEEIIELSGEEAEGNRESAADILGAMGDDTLNADDIEALDNLFNEIDVDLSESEDDDKKTKKKKEKKPWYLALFGNVKVPEDKIKPEPTPEEIAAKKAEAAEAKKAKAEEKKAAADEKKKAAAEAKAEKAKQTAEQKEAAKAKKKAEIEKLILEETDNTTRINKAGAAVIFAIFVGIAALILSGGNTITYKAQIKKAQKDYDNALLYQDVNFYQSAYEDIYGLELEEEDYKLGEKIYTVNFVSKQITSFNTHYAVGDYHAALNDLFKGLLRYNKWIPYAVELGAEDDLYFVRTQILDMMSLNYGISEDEAMLVLSTYAGINQTEGEVAANLYYTKYIYSVVGDVGLENNTNNE